MTEQLLQIPADIEKIITMSKRSLRLQVDTEENLTDEQVAKIVSCTEKRGWFCFLPGEKMINPEDVLKLPKIQKEFKSDKTPSERQRAVMYIYWKQKKLSDDFELYYKQEMEKKINEYKEKLEPDYNY